MSVVQCAFCKGNGKDPFNLLSELATCQVCGGRGKAEVTGQEIDSGLPCIKCGGKGVVSKR